MHNEPGIRVGASWRRTLESALVLVLAQAAPVIAVADDLDDAGGERTLATICEDPRSQICTMNYDPVCGILRDGSQKTFSNGCGACSDANIIGHDPGECK